MDATEEIQKKRFQFLHKLYDLTEGDMSRGIDMYQIGEALRFSEELTDKIVPCLEGEELIKDSVGYISILPDGIREIEKNLSNSTLSKHQPSETDQEIMKMEKEFKIDDPILSTKKISEAKEMASIFTFLYILENSIREFIDKMMTSEFGDNWFESRAPKGLRESVKERMTDDKKNSWHQRRGARSIDYLDFNQLPALVRKIEKTVIPNIIPSLEWFTQLVDEVYKSRCVVCHMNPLDEDNIQAVKLRLRQWQKHISAKKLLLLK